MSTEGRLAIHDDAGRISIVAPDGSDVLAVADAVSGEVHRQPTWSPDGRTLAWVKVTPSGSRLMLTAATETSFALPVAGFYLAWSPVGDRLLVLGASPGGGGIDAIIVDADSGRLSGLGTDQPFYVAWSPDGDEVLVRAGRDRMGVIGVGAGRFVDLGPGGPFQAPDWSVDGRRVYLVDGGTVDSLRVDDGGSLEVDGSFVTFDLGERLAYQVLRESDGVQIAFRQTAVARANRLMVHDPVSGESEVVWPDPVAGFQWSPDGRKLLFLTIESGEPPRLGWRVWASGTVIDVAIAEPTTLFARDYLPFFDQYARSQTFWSPASDAIVLPGVIDGRTGIWRADLDGTGPVFVAEGEMASWSR